MAWFQVSFFSECLSRSVPLHVLIPADVPASAGVYPVEKFKTLYLLHGYFGNCTDWLLKGNVQELSEQFNLAIVMPSGDNGFYVDQPRSGIRGSEFIGRELVEFTRKVFPLSTKREDTMIGGLSMGGYGALYNALRHSGVFGHAIMLSPPLSVERCNDFSGEPAEMGLTRGYFEALHGDLSTIMESDRNLQLFAKRLLDSGGPVPNLYAACGFNDMLASDSRNFCAHLSAIGFPHFYEEGPGGHEWPFWRAYLRRGLQHLIPEGPAEMPNPFWVENDGKEAI